MNAMPTSGVEFQSELVRLDRLAIAATERVDRIGVRLDMLERDMKRLVNKLELDWPKHSDIDRRLNNLERRDKVACSMERADNIVELLGDAVKRLDILEKQLGLKDPLTAAKIDTMLARAAESAAQEDIEADRDRWKARALAAEGHVEALNSLLNRCYVERTDGASVLR